MFPIYWLIGVNDTKELCFILMPAKKKWHRIGVLLGVYMEELVSIHQKHQRDDQCLYHMLRAWLQAEGRGKTYQKIIRVLCSKKVKADALAAEIIKKNGTYAALIASSTWQALPSVYLNISILKFNIENGCIAGSSKNNCFKACCLILNLKKGCV